MERDDLYQLSLLVSQLREDCELGENITKVKLGSKLNVKQLEPERDPQQRDVLELGRLAKHSYRVPLKQKEKPEGIKYVTKPSTPDPEGKGIFSLSLPFAQKKKA